MKIFFTMRTLLRSESGIGATEFALSLPLILMLMLGSFEMTRYVILHQKLEKIAYTVADVISQSDTVTVAQLEQAMTAATKILDPNPFSPHGVIYVSSVYKNGASAAPTVRWQYHGGGELSRTSLIGDVGAVASLPNGLTLNDKDNVIIAELFYSYEPFLTGGIFNEDVDIYKVTIFKPRLGALTTAPT